MSTTIDTSATFRATYVNALFARSQHSGATAREARIALTTARRLLTTETAETVRYFAEIERSTDYLTGKADRDAANYTAALVPGSGHDQLIAAAEAGEISTGMLMSIVPDEFGRISPFAVHVYNKTTQRSYTSRNLRLLDALNMMRRENAEGNDAHVSYDTCG